MKPAVQLTQLETASRLHVVAIGPRAQPECCYLPRTLANDPTSAIRPRESRHQVDRPLETEGIAGPSLALHASEDVRTVPNGTHEARISGLHPVADLWIDSRTEF